MAPLRARRAWRSAAECLTAPRPGFVPCFARRRSLASSSLSSRAPAFAGAGCARDLGRGSGRDPSAQGGLGEASPRWPGGRGSGESIPQVGCSSPAVRATNLRRKARKPRTRQSPRALSRQLRIRIRDTQGEDCDNRWGGCHVPHTTSSRGAIESCAARPHARRARRGATLRHSLFFCGDRLRE